ncbi:MAG: cbb3-type cytochrome oxidase assembly protein CcoS [Desulfobacterales bacterium]|jgi:cbb3-type cytochrome oxidase maturation protein
MYFPYFITYMAVGFVISLVVFFWALKNGQFKDQQRARFLPLEDERKASVEKASTIKRYEIYTLMFLALAGLAASGAVLIFSLLNAK